MAMNPNVGMANMNSMGGAVGGAPTPMMMNNGVMNAQAAAAANASGAGRQQASEQHRLSLNTYIYEYFLRQGLYECARAMVDSDVPMLVSKDERRRDENSNALNGNGDSMDADSKDDFDRKIPDDLPTPNLAMSPTDSSFLFEWFSLFWDIFHAQRNKSSNGNINQYVQHTQQQEMLRLRPEMTQQYLMRNAQQNGQLGMMNKGGGGTQLARTAIANNQNPQMQMLQQQKHNQMQRDPSGIDAARDRPSSPAQGGENAASPSKRQRVDGANFNPNQPGGMMANGRPGQGIPPQMANNPQAMAASQMLFANGINPNTLNHAQFNNFVNANHQSQQRSIAVYAQNLQQQQGKQLAGNPGMPNAGAPPGQGSPMMAQGPDGGTLNPFYSAGDMAGSGGIRPGPQSQQTAGSNHALQDYQMQLMLLEQQNKKRLMMARQEQDSMGVIPREGQAAIQGGPGQAPTGPNPQFPEASPQGMRPGASPNPADQMKRTGQTNNSGIPSPIPEGGQSRGSPNSMNFMAGGQVDANMGPHFNMNAQAQMAGMRPPSSHPGPGFNGQLTPHQMMAARQQPGAQGNMQQWQQGPNGPIGPNGHMVPQNMQGANQNVQGTPQQQNRAMPPPSAPAANAAANANNRTTASPQQAAAAPPTPNQGTKPAPKKKETKAQKDKRAAAAAKKGAANNANAAATPAADSSNAATGAENGEAPAPATPITPNFNKNGQNGTQPPAGQNAAAAAPPSAQASGQNDPNGNGMNNMENFGGMFDVGSMELNNPLNDFDFDSFLHDGDGNTDQFDFNSFGGIEGSEIGAE